jgi:hypothetical protein
MHLLVPNLVIQLVEQDAEIKAINLFRQKLSLPIQRVPTLSETHRRLIDDALALRSETGFPFWDCLLQLAANSEVETEHLFALAQRHNSQRDSIESLPVRRSSCASWMACLRIWRRMKCWRFHLGLKVAEQRLFTFQCWISIVRFPR